MMRKIIRTIGALFIVAVISITINIQKNNSANTYFKVANAGDCATICPHDGIMCIIKFTDGTLLSCPGRWHSDHTPPELGQ
jgi:hypothetical protein